MPYEDEYKKEEARIKAMVLVEKLLRPLKEKGDYRRLIEQKRFAEARRIAFSMCFSTELLHSVTEIGATSRC